MKTKVFFFSKQNIDNILERRVLHFLKEKELL